MEKCNCKTGMTEAERYAQHVLLELPECSERDRRIKEGVSTQVCIDPCIVDDIKFLWDNGIVTTGCCCGHNNPLWYPFVNVHPDSVSDMIKLGYRFAGNELNEATFLLSPPFKSSKLKPIKQ